MKNSLLILRYSLFLALFSSIYGQTEKFDVMTFSLPTGWSVEKEANSYTLRKIDEKRNQFCLMGLTRSYETKGSPKANFQHIWDSTMKKDFGVEVPKELDIDEGEITVVQGGASVNTKGVDSIASLISINGKKHFVSVLVLTNKSEYLDEVLAFLSTIDFNFPDNSPSAKKEAAKDEGNCSEEKISQLNEKMNQTGTMVRSQVKNLVQPIYPTLAKAVGAKGEVTVYIEVDENGDVVLAKAKDGHPMLHKAAEDAAKATKYHPLIIEGCRFRVDGEIVYNFSN